MTITSIETVWDKIPAASLGEISAISTDDAAIWRIPSGGIRRAKLASIFGGVAESAIGALTYGKRIESGLSITPRSFNAKGDGSTSDTNAFIDMINQCNSDKFAIDISGGKWRIDGDLPDLTHCVINNDGSGEIYVDFNSNTPLFNVNVPLIDTYDISSVDNNATYDFAGDNSDNSLVAALTVSAFVVTPVPGMVCKIYSSDPLSGIASSTAFAGEHVVIGAVNGNIVYTTSRLMNSYTTSIKLAVIDKDNGVALHGARFSVNWEMQIASNWLSKIMRISGAFAPQLNNCSFFNNSDTSLELIGCLMAQSYGLRFTKSRDAYVTLGMSGAGIVERGCTLSNHNNPIGMHIRSVYASNVVKSTDTYSPTGRGYNTRNLIVDGHGLGCFGPAFQTRSDCYDVLLEACTSDGNYYGENSGYNHFSLGGFVTAKNCRAKGSGNAFLLRKAFTGENGIRKLEDCFYSGEGKGITVSADDTLSGINRNVLFDVDGMTIDSSDSEPIYLNSCTGSLKRLNIISSSSINSHASIRVNEAGVIINEITGTIDISRETGSNYRIIRGAAGFTVRKSEIKMICNGRSWNGIVNNPSEQTVHGLFIVDTDKMPTALDGATNIAAGSTFASSIKENNSATNNNGRRPRLSISGTTNVLDIGRSAADICILTVLPTASGTKITGLTAGKVEGQELIVMVDPSAAYTVEVVPSDLGFIRTSNNKIMGAKDAIKFIWTFDADKNGINDTGIWEAIQDTSSGNPVSIVQSGIAGATAGTLPIRGEVMLVSEGAGKRYSLGIENLPGILTITGEDFDASNNWNYSPFTHPLDIVFSGSMIADRNIVLNRALANISKLPYHQVRIWRRATGNQTLVIKGIGADGNTSINLNSTGDYVWLTFSVDHYELIGQFLSGEASPGKTVVLPPNDYVVSSDDYDKTLIYNSSSNQNLYIPGDLIPRLAGQSEEIKVVNAGSGNLSILAVPNQVSFDPETFYAINTSTNTFNTVSKAWSITTSKTPINVLVLATIQYTGVNLTRNPSCVFTPTHGSAVTKANIVNPGTNYQQTPTILSYLFTDIPDSSGTFSIALGENARCISMEIIPVFNLHATTPTLHSSRTESTTDGVETLTHTFTLSETAMVVAVACASDATGYNGTTKPSLTAVSVKKRGATGTTTANSVHAFVYGWGILSAGSITVTCDFSPGTVVQGISLFTLALKAATSGSSGLIPGTIAPLVTGETALLTIY